MGLKHSDSSPCVTTEAEVSMRRIVGFVSVDENGDGLLDSNEFLRYLTTLTHRKLTDQDAQGILKQFDVDGNGYLDYQELMRFHDSGLMNRLNDYVKMTCWSRETADLLKDVPLRDIVNVLQRHLQEGGEARVLKTDNQLVVKLLSISATGHS